jgi:hypothetical protein
MPVLLRKLRDLVLMRNDVEDNIANALQAKRAAMEAAGLKRRGQSCWPPPQFAETLSYGNLSSKMQERYRGDSRSCDRKAFNALRQPSAEKAIKAMEGAARAAAVALAAAAAADRASQAVRVHRSWKKDSGARAKFEKDFAAREHLEAKRAGATKVPTPTTTPRTSKEPLLSTRGDADNAWQRSKKLRSSNPGKYAVGERVKLSDPEFNNWHVAGVLFDGPGRGGPGHIWLKEPVSKKAKAAVGIKGGKGGKGRGLFGSSSSRNSSNSEKSGSSDEDAGVSRQESLLQESSRGGLFKRRPRKLKQHWEAGAGAGMAVTVGGEVKVTPRAIQPAAAGIGAAPLRAIRVPIHLAPRLAPLNGLSEPPSPLRSRRPFRNSEPKAPLRTSSSGSLSLTLRDA